jgi:TonB family protein
MSAMRTKWLPRLAYTLFAISLLIPTAIRSQEKASPTAARAASPHYPNTTEGLRQLLQELRSLAKDGDNPGMVALVKAMEIPNCDAWLHQMYEPDKADSWMALCDANTLESKEKSMQEMFVELATQEGEISTRKVNDDPEPGNGMEWGWLQAIKHPLDIYFASWKSSSPSENHPKGEPIGYFMFIDGGFRWESSISFAKLKTGPRPKVVPAKLLKRVEPVYPPEANSQHIAGTVRVYFVIGADGAVYNAHAISGEGLSNDPSLRKAAEEAVIQWRYEPATIDGKPAQMNAVTVDVKFSP